MGQDLASSTEFFLCDYLTRNGNSVTLASPGSLEDPKFTHRKLRDVRFPGLTSISGGRNARKLLVHPDINSFDLVLVDWRFTYTLSIQLIRLGIPWMIIDRGPPIKSGILGKLHKWYWRKAWEIADDYASAGLTVSKNHDKFVRRHTGFEGRLHSVWAGSERNVFLNQKSDPKELLKMAYVGQLDLARGVGKIFDLSMNLTSSDINHQIHICGKGDQEKLFKKRSDGNKIIFHGQKNRLETMEILSRCHVGIMPMPDTPLWRISSPLKLAEYLASGLLVIGPKHEGNMAGVLNESFILESNDWEELCIPNLKKRIKEDWDEVIQSSLNLSEGLMWDHIANDLEGFFLEVVPT